VDLLVSIALVSACFLLLHRGKAGGTDRAALAAEIVRANQIVVERIETIRRCRWDQINSNGFIPTSFTEHFLPPVSAGKNCSAPTPGVGPKGEITYYGTITISNAAVAGVYKAELKELTVALNWTHSNGPRSYYLKTFVSPNRMPDNTY